MSKLAQWWLPLGLILVAWASSPWPWLRHHDTKWFLVHFWAWGAAVLAWRQGALCPNLSRRETIGLGLVAAAALAHLFWLRGDAYALSLLDRVSFVLLVWASWSAFRRGDLHWHRFRWPITAALVVTTAYGLWQVATSDTSGTNRDVFYVATSSTFGYTNNTAQFVALALLALAALGWPAAPGARLALVGTGAAGFAYLLLTRGRSAMLAFAVAAFVLALTRANRRWRPYFVGGAAAAAVVVVVAALYAQDKGPFLTYRLDVWRQTVRMIAAHPLGVGVDQFEFRFLPYHRQGTTLSETHLANSPHAEWLRYPAEDGLPLALAFAALLAYVLWRWWQAGGRGRGFLLPTFAFFAVEALVQFPFKNPWPVYWWAILLGGLAAEVWDKRELSLTKWRAAAGLAFLTAFALLLSREGLSRFWEREQDVAKVSTACRLMPGNWRACLQSVEAHLRERDAGAARKVAQEMITREPHNMAAIRAMMVVAGAQGDLLETCFYGWKYHDFFFYGSMPDGQLKQVCPARWLDYFQRRRPQKYYGGWRPGKSKGGLKPLPNLPQLQMEPVKP